MDSSPFALLQRSEATERVAVTALVFQHRDRVLARHVVRDQTQDALVLNHRARQRSNHHRHPVADRLYCLLLIHSDTSEIFSRFCALQLPMPLPAHLRSHKNHTYLLFLLIQKPSFLTPLLCCSYWLAGRLLSESRVRFEVPATHQLMHNFLNARRQCAFLYDQNTSAILSLSKRNFLNILDNSSYDHALLFLMR